MRYIDADKLIEELDRTFFANQPREVVRATIEYFPTADVVEVVRCKNCKYWDNHDGGERCLNEVSLSWAQPDSFCNHGKRREDGEIH